MNKLVTVEGDFIARADGISETVPYTEDFVFNDTITKGEARAIARRLVVNRLKKKNPDLKLLQTCQVTDIKPTDKKAEQPELVKIWLEAITLSCIPDSIDQYRDEKSKTEALNRAIERAKKRKAEAGRKKEQDYNLGSAVL